MLEHVSDLLLQFDLPLLFVLESVQIGLKRNLLGGVGEPPITQPHPMTMAPGLAFEPEIAAEHKRLDTNAGAPNVGRGRVASANQIAQSLMQGIGHPDVCELTGTMEPGQGNGVPSVILDSLAWFARGKRGRADAASEPESRQLALYVVTARSSFVDELYGSMLLLDAASNLGDSRRRVLDIAEMPNLAEATGVGDSNGYCRLVYVQPNKCIDVAHRESPR